MSARTDLLALRMPGHHLNRRQIPMPATLAWTALDLTDVRTDTLRSLDLRNGPPAARTAILAELAARRTEH
jgi:hypothetical protein